jgi:hypothetical protein
MRSIGKAQTPFHSGTGGYELPEKQARNPVIKAPQKSRCRIVVRLADLFELLAKHER